MAIQLGDVAPDFTADACGLEGREDVIIAPAVSDEQAKEKFPRASNRCGPTSG
jgi:hypothetical protein